MAVCYIYAYAWYIHAYVCTCKWSMHVRISCHIIRILFQDVSFMPKYARMNGICMYVQVE
jgi:hypothetical protein